MKKFISVPLLMLFSVNLFSQITIQGSIIEKETNQPLGYVNVALMQGTTPVKGTMSTEDGTFIFENVQKGTYVVKANFMGFDDINKTITLTGKIKSANLGNLYMSENAKMLKEIEVVAQGSQMKFDIDKKVFSVDQNIAAAGGDVTELLENIPSVEVDSEGEISLRNNSNVEIWINGKPAGLTEENRAQILEQIPAENLASIEVITNPSAKYSPEGSAGVINLVMKKDRKAGYYGSVNTGLDYALGAKLPSENMGANFNFNVKKFDGYVNIGVRNNERGNISDTHRDLFRSDTIIGAWNQHVRNDRNKFNITGRVGLNYQINDKHSLGFSGYFMTQNQNNKSHYNYGEVKENDSTFYDRDVKKNQGRLSGNATLDYTWEIDKKGSELRASAIYSQFHSESKSNYIQENINLDQIQNSESNNRSGEIKLDFVKRIRQHKIEVGSDAKYQERYNDANGNDRGIENPTLKNNYNYQEQLYALYASYGSTFRQFSVQAGVRGEYIIIDNNCNGNQAKQKTYFEPFPTLFLAYALPKKNELQLNVTRRINRPRGRQINSYKDVSDSTNVKFGNPDLNPEFVWTSELNHIKSWENHTLSTGIFYNLTEDLIQDVQYLDANKILNSTYKNASKRQSVGVELILKNSFTKWFNLTTTVNLFYQELFKTNLAITDPQTFQVYNIQIDGNNIFTWDAKMLANFMFTKTFTGQATASYKSDKMLAQGVRNGFFALDLGLKKTFFDRRLSLAFSIRDVANTRKFITITSSNNFKQRQNLDPFGPMFRITAAWNFGNGKNKKKSSSPEEREESMEEMMEEI